MVRLVCRVGDSAQQPILCLKIQWYVTWAAIVQVACRMQARQQVLYHLGMCLDHTQPALPLQQQQQQQQQQEPP
jgi:hypothetical protein